MFDNNIKKIIYDTYNYLKSINIIGKRRIDFIETTFKCHITSVYNWIKEFTDNFNNTYNNKNINPDIIISIYNYIKNNKTTSVDNIKKYINNKYNTSFNVKTIGYILKVNDFKTINNKINKDIINFILDTIKKIMLLEQKKL